MTVLYTTRMNDFAISEITGKTGMGAVFIRGFMEAFYQGETSLYNCQSAGKAAVIDEGTEISDSYLKSTSKLMQKHFLFSKRRVGKHWQVMASTNTEAFKKFLLEDHPMWGNMLNSTEDDFADKVRVMKHMDEFHSIRATRGKPIPKAGYAYLQKMYQAGELDIAFIPKGAKAAVKVDGSQYSILTLKDGDDE